MMKTIVYLFLTAFPFAAATAQHADSSHAMHDMETMQGATMQTEMSMSSFTLPGLSMHRDGSGTSWLPDASPMESWHSNRGGWNLMFHGAVFGRYTAQDVFESGSRGDQKLDAPNWFMGMASHPVGHGGQIAFRSMVSLDPLTEGGAGYPLLFQTGETFEGEPLIDRQHPHDLFSELSITYGQSLGEGVGVFAYVGLPGEPALGPVSFMHRPSARFNPDSPLGHHWQDATHVTFGVATLGLRVGMFKLDGSLFTGREPNEDRYDFDRPRFDSYSLRLSANPTPELALQVSRGFLKSPETLEPDADIWRTTASAIYNRPLAGGTWSNTLLWGMNQGAEKETSEHDEAEDGHGTQHTFLAESNIMLGKQAFYTRAEWTQKPAAELGLFDEVEAYHIGALTLGTVRQVFTNNKLQVMLGLQGSVYAVPDDLQANYGSNPVSLEVYLRLSPTQLIHHAITPMP